MEGKIIPKKLNDYSYLVEKEGKMLVPLKIFASEKLMEKMVQDRCIQQGINVAALPGIKGFSIMMPDAHQGYGFSIGGVAAISTHHGCISPGGIGFDINCGVRLLTTNLKKDIVYKEMQHLLETIFQNVPPGVGRKSHFKLSKDDLNEVLKEGVNWAIKNNYGNEEDQDHCEDNGKLPNANPDLVSEKAKSRGLGQLGTLGAGNHFLEVQYIEKIFDEEAAKAFGLKEGQVCLMIHCGSRGLGHQVCTDYLRKMEDEYPDIIKNLPEKDLIYAPSDSKLAKEYFQAMCAAANFAFTNRHMIGHQVKESFKEVFGDVEMHTVYDIAHNIAKVETHDIDGKEEEVYVHRKGATRAFGPGRKEIPDDYKKIGQPIFIPGSMGTSSYVLAGTEKAMKESFGSTAHGAGRAMSRHEANRRWRGEKLKHDLEKEKIFIKAASWRGISEEAPLAYKDVDEVVRVSDKAGIGKIVAKLKPMGVVKG